MENINLTITIKRHGSTENNQALIRHKPTKLDKFDFYTLSPISNNLYPLLKYSRNYIMSKINHPVLFRYAYKEKADLHLFAITGRKWFLNRYPQPPLGAREVEMLRSTPVPLRTT